MGKKRVNTLLRSFENIKSYYEEHGKIFIFLGEGLHKIKKKAEQAACKMALEIIGESF